MNLYFSFFCGERGIRTPGASQLNGFQDRRNRPLCHLSFVATGLPPLLLLTRAHEALVIFLSCDFFKSGAKVLLFFQIHKFFIKILANMRKI